MKVIDLGNRIIFVDIIKEIYYIPARTRGNSENEYFVKTTNGDYQISYAKYNELAKYLLSLNDEVEIIEVTPEEDKIPRVSLLDVKTDYKLKNILNEIIDKVNGE